MDTPTPKSSQPTSAGVIPCRHLRCKEMYHDSPEDDAFASGIYSCGRTLEACGPDGEPCGRKECCAQRTCYLE